MAFHIPDSLADSLVWLWSYHPTVSGIINQAPIVFTVHDTDEYKAQVRGRHVQFSRSFIEECNDFRAVAGVMAHEVFHYMMNHSELHYAWYTAQEVTGKLRSGNSVTYPYHEVVVQHALDYSINDALVKMGITLPSDRLYDPHSIGGWADAEGDLYVRVYQRYQAQGKLPPNQPCPNGPPQPGQGNGPPQPGKGKGQPQPGEGDILADDDFVNDVKPGNGAGDVQPFDPHTPGNDPGHKTEIVRQELTAYATLKARGRMAGEIEKLLERIAPKRFPWTEVVRPRFQHILGRSKPTWRRVDRPAMAVRTILQGREGTRAGKVLLVADTSGSIGHKEQENFVENALYLMQDCRPKELWFVEIDALVRRDTKMNSIHELRRFIQPMKEGRGGLYGGGGTDMREAWTWMTATDRPSHWTRQAPYTPDIVLFLTDGSTPFPTDIHPAEEVIWVMTTEIKAPEHAGRTARMFID